MNCKIPTKQLILVNEARERNTSYYFPLSRKRPQIDALLNSQYYNSNASEANSKVINEYNNCLEHEEFLVNLEWPESQDKIKLYSELPEAFLELSTGAEDNLL